MKWPFQIPFPGRLHYALVMQLPVIRIVSKDVHDAEALLEKIEALRHPYCRVSQCIIGKTT